MRRLALPCLVVAVLAAGCDPSEAPGPDASGTATAGAPSSAPPTPSASPSGTDVPSPSPGTPAPPVLPDGVPSTYEDDVDVRDLPVGELVPQGDEVTSVARTRGGPVEAAVISFTSPDADPFARAHGFVVWRRQPGADPPWRAVYGLEHPRRAGVLAIAADVTDLTGDGAPDALIREETGGSGQCATYRVVDLDAGAPIWQRAVCDAMIQPNPDPIGLFEVTRIYGPHDPHCCPGAIRERVLAWDGARFAVVDRQVTPLP
jgi:hypothetical protein